MKRHLLLIVSVLAISISISAQSSGFKELDQWVDIWKEAQQTFFGIDSPCGLFLCTRETYDNQNNFNVTYLNGNMKMTMT